MAFLLWALYPVYVIPYVLYAYWKFDFSMKTNQRMSFLFLLSSILCFSTFTYLQSMALFDKDCLGLIISVLFLIMSAVSFPFPVIILKKTKNPNIIQLTFVLYVVLILLNIVTWFIGLLQLTWEGFG